MANSYKVRRLIKKLERWTEKRASKNLEHYTLSEATNYLKEWAYVLENTAEEDIDALIEMRRAS